MGRERLSGSCLQPSTSSSLSEDLPDLPYGARGKITTIKSSCRNRFLWDDYSFPRKRSRSLQCTGIRTLGNRSVYNNDQLCGQLTLTQGDSVWSLVRAQVESLYTFGVDTRKISTLFIGRNPPLESLPCLRWHIHHGHTPELNYDPMDFLHSALAKASIFRQIGSRWTGASRIESCWPSTESLAGTEVAAEVHRVVRCHGSWCPQVQILAARAHYVVVAYSR